jgi:phosphonopyruvate decarboxylase
MISPADFLEQLKHRGIGLFTGVPDSLLKNFCALVDDQGGDVGHIIAANEGNAIAIAAGYHLGSGKLAAVYMQNSGLGNTINPLTSITDPEVYRIPLLMIIGWRGEPGIKDEPQHVKQGRITPGQLELLEIPHWILEADSDPKSVLDEAFATLQSSNSPVALLVRADTFSNYKSQRKTPQLSALKREDALRQVLSLASPDDVVLSTTGKTSREVFELRVERDEAQRDFLTVGGMGHTASIALGVALGNPARRVLCLDGDGSLLMHMGALAIIGDLKPTNFVHVLLNNGAHESVGGQPTVAGGLDFSAIASAVGYSAYFKASTLEELTAVWPAINGQVGPLLLEIRICAGSRDNLGRPTSTPDENKRAFMEVACRK